MRAPDCYLASTEGYGLEEPRACWRIKRLATTRRKDLLLMRICPPLPRNSYGLEKDIDLILVAPRHQGSSLFRINRWPVYVHVARFLIDDPEVCEGLQDGDFKSIAWGELYRTEEDARLKRT